jgi:ribosome-associated heat shock protein Hsp15
MSAASVSGEASGTQRLDKWLWFARFTKTRTLAADTVQSGKVRLNRVRVDKPSQPVRVDDVLTLVLNRRVRLVKIVALGERRGPSATARELYEELTAEADPNKPLLQSSMQIPSLRQHDASPARRVPGSGRPTKKERREIDRLSGRPR